MEQAAAERGGFPLVHSTDNGAAYKSAGFGIQYLETFFTGTGGLAPRIGAPDPIKAIAAVDVMAYARGVIAFKNLPHTPRRNPVAERAVR